MKQKRKVLFVISRDTYYLEFEGKALYVVTVAYDAGLVDKKRTLYFENKEEAEEVKQGYKFFANDKFDKNII